MFTFKGITADSMGLIVNKLPEREIAFQEYKMVDVEGRDGTLTEVQNYKNKSKSIKCTIKDRTKIDLICAWLQGSGQLILNNESDRYYEARVSNKISFKNIVAQVDEFEIKFECQPFAKDIVETSLVVTQTNKTITVTNAPIHPIIELVGNGTFKVTVNGVDINLNGVNPNIKIDSSLMNATSIDGATNLNSKMVGQFPILKVGDNTIKYSVISGTFTSCTLKYRKEWY